MKAFLALIVVAAVLIGSFFLFREKPSEPPLKGPELIQTPLDKENESGLETRREDQEPSLKRETLPSKVEEEEKDPVDESYKAALTGLKGRILWESNRKPVVGIKVEVFELGSGFTSKDWNGRYPSFLSSFEPKTTATTDKDGSFVLNGLERNEFLGLLIGAGTDKRAFRMVDRTPAPGEIQELDDILLQGRGSLKGIVFGPNQKPLRGVKVYALDIPRVAFDFGLSGYDPKGLLVSQNSYRSFATFLPPFIKKLEKKLPFGISKTGPDGSFHIKGLRKGQTSILIVAPDLERTIKTTTIRPGKERDLGRIQMREGNGLSGQIHDGEGKPLGGVMVSVTPKSPVSISFGRKPKKTDPQGAFGFKGLGRGQHFVLTRFSEDLPWKLHGPFRPGDKIEIRREKGLSRKILVQSKSGVPLSTAKFDLKLNIGGDVPPELFDTGLRTKQHLKKTEEPGSWILHDLPPGRYSLQVSAKGFAPFKTSFQLGKKGESRPILCKLLPGVSVSILAQDRSGRLVSSARIYFRERSRSNILLGRTGMDGTLKIPMVPRGRGTFIARHPRFALGTTQVALPVNGATYRVILPSSGGIQGRIFNSTSPEKKAYTLFIEPSWATRKNLGDLLLPRFTVSNIDGRFSIKGLQPGEYRVMPFIDVGKLSSISDTFRAQRQVYLLSRKRITVIVPEGGYAQVSLDLGLKGERSGSGKIYGFVRIDGKAASGTEIVIEGTTTQRTTTKANGSFQFSNLPKGRFQVVVLDKEARYRNNALTSKRITLKDGEPKGLDFDIHLGSIEGLILDPQGKPYDRSQLILRTKGKNPSWISVFTDDQGRFQRKVHFGKWSIGLGWDEQRKAGFSLPEKKVEVNSSQPVKVRIQGIENLSIQGTIVLDFSKVHPDWIDFARKSYPRQAYFQGKNAWWQIPLKKDGSPSPLGQKKHPLGEFKVLAYGGGGSWRTKIKITSENHLTLRIVLEPPKLFTLPKKKRKKKVKRK
jgi:hypothetical protein